MNHPFDLTGRTALVTGGGRGLGLGISTSLLRAGADVVVLGRGAPAADLAEEAARCGRRLVHHAVDLADAAAVAATAAAVLAEHRVDVLVNNAGTQERHPAVEFPLDAFDRVLDVNLRAVFQLCQLFGAPMLERGEGRVVNIASLLSFQGGLTVPAYAASKGAVAQLTKALCNEWAGRGVGVNAVAPGYMATDMNEALLADPVRREQLSVRIPAGRWGTPQDVGDVVVFLASPAAAYVHGHVLAVDGGWLAR
ncbi:2-deoxy-D-gluconate 3-dehydrogenase [Kineococcus radiotolerans]|uniref:Short-chain dehydrogenase/reductase SDR n=2 Tax=Kineococcus radiotolerans TaxID=131568 RepID=A6W4F2_KINRD|nr:glucose 1-dehydrogenase [Kineococcus radiotolerans]ABS01691.1 short-chain dehydrogenase/reductase SDR [Kineococcus radiotolerans SRS30216 = ATCC BAA-149]MBB2901179.1 2-deoxy-D-gluconate 3-dehydrogenase [Kineococcus radiotolerans]